MEARNAGSRTVGPATVNPVFHSEIRTEVFTISNESAANTTPSTSTESQRSCARWPRVILEDRTYRVGKLLGTYPILPILVAISIVGTGSMGFLNFHIESRPEQMWVDRSSSAYLAKEAALAFPVGNRIRLTVIVTAPDIFQRDLLALIHQIDDTVTTFYTRKKSWNDLCFKKNSECQKFSLLSFVDRSDHGSVSPEDVLSAVNQPGKRRLGILPPFFIAPDDVLAGLTTNNSGYVVEARVTRMVYFLQKQEPERIASSKPMGPEEVLQRRLSDLYGSGLGLNGTSVTVVLKYAEGDPSHVAPFIPFDYVIGLVYSCIAYLLLIFVATGRYTTSRNGFWLAVSGLISVALAMAFGFGIASAVGMPFTPLHCILPLLLLCMSVFGFLALELELRVVSDSRPTLLRNEKLGRALQRSFSTLLLCLLSNFLVFAVGIGSKLPAVRSFCVYGVTSAVGIFISQVFFLFGCLAAWQATYETAANAWIFCLRRTQRSESDTSYSLYSLLRPAFGFLASNLSDNIGRGFVLLAVAVLTGVCIYFLFSLRILFDLGRFEKKDEAAVALPDDMEFFQNMDDSVACVYLGNAPYHQRLSELKTFQSYIKEHAAVRPRSVSSWLDYFQGYTQDQQRVKGSANRYLYDNSSGTVDKAAFYNLVTKFVFEKNFEEDVLLMRKSDDQIEIQSSRICFRFRIGLPSENYSSAVENIARVAWDLQIGGAAVDSRMLLEVLVQKTLSSEFWILFGAYFVVLLIVSALLIQNVVSALLVFISSALIAVQSVGLISILSVPMDSLLLVVMFCLIAVICQMMHYTSTIFGRLYATHKRKARLKATMISAGPPALACGLCAIAIFVPFFSSSLEVFRFLLKIAYTTIGVGLLHVFLFVPVSLSTATPEALTSATLKLRRRLTKKIIAEASSSPTSQQHFDGGVAHASPHPPDPPNDQVLFVARNNPLERNGSSNSLRLHLKNAGLRAVLESLPSPEGSDIAEEPAVSSNPGGDSDRDSLANVDISQESAPGRQGSTATGAPTISASRR